MQRLGTASSPEEWLRRAFSEVWNARAPRSQPNDVRVLRSFLASRWLGEQERYYRDATAEHGRRHRRLAVGVAGAFLLTIAAAILHSVGFGHRKHSGEFVTVLSLTLPALGAALSGLAAQREDLRHAERYQWLADTLAAARRRMEAAPDVRTVQTVAAEAELALLEEHRDWFGVMQFHDFELHM